MGAPSAMTKKQVIDCIQRKRSLVAADLRGVDLSGLCFDDMDLRGAKLAECNLARATFRRANLQSASLWNTDCKDACFDYANLESVDFDYSNLDGATLRQAKVRKAIFPLSNLSLEEVKRSVSLGTRLRMTRPMH